MTDFIGPLFGRERQNYIVTSRNLNIFCDNNVNMIAKKRHRKLTSSLETTLSRIFWYKKTIAGNQFVNVVSNLSFDELKWKFCLQAKNNYK